MYSTEQLRHVLNVLVFCAVIDFWQLCTCCPTYGLHTLQSCSHVHWENV